VSAPSINYTQHQRYSVCAFHNQFILAPQTPASLLLCILPIMPITAEEQALIATYHLNITKHEELKTKIGEIQEQIIRRCAGGSSCDILRHLKFDLSEAKEGAADHLVAACKALRTIHTEMDECRLSGTEQSIAKLNQLEAAISSASKMH